MFGVGPTELFIVCLVALLLFGNRVPSVMRSLGKGMSEFKRGLNEVTKDIES
jgi:sec-independent protein translocase protein TatA